MRGDILPRRGTVCPSVDCPGGCCALVQNVRGDIPHGGTMYPPTPVCTDLAEGNVTISAKHFWKGKGGGGGGGGLLSVQLCCPLSANSASGGKYELLL